MKWILTWVGLFILVVEIVSKFRPVFNVKGSHMILLLVLIAGVWFYAQGLHYSKPMAQKIRTTQSRKRSKR